MNYIINGDINGFESIDINNSIINTGKDNTVVIVLDGDSNNSLHSYYNAVRELMLNKINYL